MYVALMAATMVASCAQDGPMVMCQVDSLVKVLSSDSAWVESADTVHVARGENALFQFVLTSSEQIDSLQAEVERLSLGKTTCGWVHDVVSNTAPQGCDDMLSTPDNTYPDPIIDDDLETLDTLGHKTLWVDVNIPRDAEAGLYKGKVSVTGWKDGKKMVTKKPLYIQVYPVTLPEEQGLKMVNHHGPVTLMNDGEPVKGSSERYLELFQKVAEMAGEYGQNCWVMHERPQLLLNEDSTDFVLDFTWFDRVLEMLQQHGNLKYFCNGYMGGRPSDLDWNAASKFNASYVKDKQIVNESMDYTDPRLRTYIERYYSQVEKHFREKGWLNICYQHIADEPALKGTESQKSWTAVAGMVKEMAPGLRTIDACSEIVENQDVSVVILGDNIATMPPVPEGCERWMYTCCGPQGNFANRFVQQPLIKTRILHWINYRYNECGYLHWGLTRWDICKDPMHDVTPDGHDWPGGDCYIMYPGHEKVYPSIRLCAMRDGVRDYDLLKMVEAKSPEKAMELCQSVIQGPDKYNTDVKHFNEVRRQMLEFLSSQD